MKLSELKKNPNNPRLIKDEKFKKLVQSLHDFPQMMELRPIIINGDNMVLGGNMRLAALKELNYKDMPDNWVMKASDLTPEQQKEFIIKDNVGFGEWEWDQLANEWDIDQLEEWGLDIPIWENESNNNNEDDKYTQKIDTPVYEPKNEKPKITELYNAERYKELISEIDNSSIDNDVKVMLKVAASRHIVFNYENMADYYANSENEVQTLMENSALVIIDFNRAIELGYVKLREEIAAQYGKDYGDDE